MFTRTFALFALATLSACELVESSTEPSTTDTGVATDSATDPVAPASATRPNEEGGDETAGRWTLRGHTCPGDGVDTMWWDADEQTVWMGCASNAEGYGLHRSPDRGETWPALDTDPRGALGGRVGSVSRSSDGRIYVAGEQLLGGQQVVSVDDSVRPFRVEGEYDAGSTIDDVQFAGGFARTASGLSVVEAMNGTQIAVRWHDGGFWQDAAGWAGGATVQIQSIEAFGDDIYATGSTMNMAPMLFLPPRGGHVEADGFQLVVVELYDYAQELRTLDVDPHGNLVAGGVDHGLATGVLYISNEDPRDAHDYTQVWLDEWLGTDPTWIDGVCRHGDRVAAVGRYSTSGDPIAMVSTDGGITWIDATRTLTRTAPSLSKCAFLDDGTTLAIAGSNGFLGFYSL